MENRFRASAPWLIGWEAAKANATPAFVLSADVRHLVSLLFPSAEHGILNQVADYKQRNGIAFVLASSAVVGWILPELFVIIFFQNGRIKKANAENFIF
jgi:hypothetical protein